MRKLFFYLIPVIILFIVGCNGKKKAVQPDENNTEVSSPLPYLDMNDLFTNADLPQSVDLSMDISTLSIGNLRLLYNYIYAVHGMHFKEAELHSFFSANTKWYESYLSELWEKDKMPQSYSDVSLSAEEQAFADAIDLRIKGLQKMNYISRAGSVLGNTENIVNLFQFKDIDENFSNKISENNFVITSGANLQLFHIYEENDYRQLPSFITTDLYLQAFHMYFSYTLKSLEQQKFIPILSELCLGMYIESQQMAKTGNQQIKEMAEYNATFYAIPYYFLTGKKLSVANKHKKHFEAEINKINEQNDSPSDFLDFRTVEFPYSLFKPRGHYTRKEEMQNYFKAMMWLQTAPFCRDNNERLRQTIFSSVLLNTGKTKEGKSLINLYRSIYDPIVFLVGLPDNLSFMDIADFHKQSGINDMKTALRPFNIAKVNQMLIDLSKTRNVIKPKIEISCPDKINFMPQRYLIDNDVIQNLVDVNKNSNRAYPRGLDVFAAFGSASANDLLNGFYKEKDNWEKYPTEMAKMKAKFYNYEGWDSSIYNKWIESLVELQKKDKNYPEFMQTKAWDYKNLNTSLASWAELKHDAILYAEQPMSAECGGGGPPPPIVRGYVEPNLKFWEKLDEMVVLTKNLLEKNDLMTQDLQGKTEQLSNYISFLLQVTKKELAKEPLTESEYSTIQVMGSSIEYFTLSVIDPELYLDSWSLVQGPDKSIAVVADIYTRNVPECNKNGVLHVATGNANNIYVVVEIDGFLYLTKGATFSYYEFVQPSGERLTDEEWQKMLEDKKAPAIQEWMKDIIIDTEPKMDERVSYSSGC